MSIKTFHVPKNHVLDEILAFGSELAEFHGRQTNFRFDFQGKGLDTPFGMLFLSCAIRNFIDSHPDARHVPINFETRSYASYMGFFHACGFLLADIPGRAGGSDSHLPITIMRTSDLFEMASNEVREVGNVIEEHSKKLAGILLQREYGALFDLLSYSLREMIRNIVEHSQSETISLCAQYRTKAMLAEIAILDTGVGIRNSLSNNPHLTIESDREAINLALMPGISGKMFKGVRADPFDFWQNSGYGLYVVSRLCGHGGKFTICSGDTALSLKPKRKEYRTARFQGTALRIDLSLRDFKSSSDTITKIVKDGAKQAKELGDLGVHASTASKMLSDEFNIDEL